MSDLELLEQRYLGPAWKYREKTEVRYLVDGRDYLREIDAAVRDTKKGDRVYLVDWSFDAALELGGRAPDAADRKEIGDLLVARAQEGVDVRVVLNGGQYLGATGMGPFLSNYETMADLRTRIPSGATTPPLATKVLYDWTGAEMTGTHHQKAAVIVHGGVLTAFVAGIDIKPLPLDATPHTRRALRIDDTVVLWGWHDGGVKLVGAAAEAVYENFVHRWQEAATLPPSTLWIKQLPSEPGPARRILYTPGTEVTVPPVPAQATADPTVGATVQVLRSRFDTKLDRPGARGLKWSTAGGGALREVYATLSRAISAAQRYVYIEDQYLADHPPLANAIDEGAWQLFDRIVDDRAPRWSLFPLLKAAARRGVKIIMVGSGYADPEDSFTGEKNTHLSRQLVELADGNEGQIAVWRLLQTTVHMKLTLIDDEFAAIGSANLQARSMLGVDSELHVAVVSTEHTVRDLRARLWGEHLNLDYEAGPESIRTALNDLERALGMWRRHWGPGIDWFTAGHPEGFTPAELGIGLRTNVVRAYVGPGGSA